MVTDISQKACLLLYWLEGHFSSTAALQLGKLHSGVLILVKQKNIFML